MIGCATWLLDAAPARACGCLSPPIPRPGAVDFAVNQQAEQIIFEVEPDGHIVAHVLIRYAGDPEKFAWIVPVPTVPELELSYAETFGLIDQQTAPQVTASAQNICPRSLYQCRQHSIPYCGPTMFPSAPSPNAGAPIGFSGAAGAGGGGAAPMAPPVTVYARQQVGSYDTVVFGAGDAMAAVDWLQTEGFIVNDTMTPYMQPYLDAQMLFVAAKLIPGADADEIRPLRMRYEGTEPMVPIQLTAVAAEPHLTVTTYIYGSSLFAPLDQTTFTGQDIPEDAISTASGRSNYPMVLSRLIDEEGGHAFMLEYAGATPRYTPQSPCCQSTGFDMCGITGDGQCQCPLSPFDEQDCAQQEELVGGIQLVQELSTKHSFMTRLTTRLSPEEMTFDPMFAPDPLLQAQLDQYLRSGDLRMRLQGIQYSFDGCADDLIEREAYDDNHPIEGCAGVYCARGECVATEAGAGCVCNPGQVARSFTDLDGQQSMTCVPEQAPVDLAAGGLEIPDVCELTSAVQMGDCVNIGGFPAARCPNGTAATLSGSGSGSVCSPITHESGTSGARNYTHDYPNLRICAPAPPACDVRLGWLEEIQQQQRPSVEACDSSIAHPSWLQMPPAPTCPSTTGSTGGSAGVGAGGSGAPRFGSPSGTTTEPRMQQDTTLPRGQMQAGDSSDNCSCRTVGAHPAGSRLAPWLLLLLALTLLPRATRQRRS